MNRLKIKADVNDLIKEYDLSVPVDVELLAKRLGVEIKRHGFDEELSGFALHREGEKFIGVNSNEGEKRQRFTIAHELGHLQLHRSQSVNVDKGVMMLRDSHSSDGTDMKEIEANRFAAELLMPENSLREDLAGVGGVDLVSGNDDSRDSVISKLADKYNVSYQAMSIRLASLYFS